MSTYFNESSQEVIIILGISKTSHDLGLEIKATVNEI